MRITLAAACLLLFSLNTFGSGLSASRQAGEDFSSARERSYSAGPLELYNLEPLPLHTPETERVPLVELDATLAPELADLDELAEVFAFVRDRRWLKDHVRGAKRRLTWLYPDDGCYARAEMMRWFVQHKSLPEPAKVFAFGRLKVASSNAPKGFVRWWYHVAISYRVGDTLYVLDPAVEPSYALTLKEWNERMGSDDESIEYSLCSAKSFVPNSDCYEQRGLNHFQAIQQQLGFLNLEWDRLVDLGRSPERELLEYMPTAAFGSSMP